MGWSSGSELMSEVIFNLKKRQVSKEVRKLVYEILIPAMHNQDWDTEFDCSDQDEVYEEVLLSIINQRKS